ncbi:MAG: Mur ligase family protein, partial [Synergistaceae bacterium]|nr:Mur ligase family protein [Synergistaceae bacterium]
MKLFEIIHFLEESKANPKFYPINKQDAVVVGGAPPLAPFRVGVLHDNAHPGVPHSDVLHTNPDDNPEIVEIFSDSRKVTEDSIFCCISGKEADGHDYALSALSAGAVAVFAEKYLPECKVPQIIVNSTREWMGKVAAKIYGEPAKQLKMYAVTGTNGKTTTTWVIRSLLESIGIKCGLVGTVLQNDGLNDLKSEYTTPESCDIQRLLSRMVRNGCKACVMETSSHGLDMGRLDGCEFDVMVFNNLSPEHLDYHKTMENYFSAKCLLF